MRFRFSYVWAESHMGLIFGNESGIIWAFGKIAWFWSINYRPNGQTGTALADFMHVEAKGAFRCPKIKKGTPLPFKKKEKKKEKDTLPQKKKPFPKLSWPWPKTTRAWHAWSRNNPQTSTRQRPVHGQDTWWHTCQQTKLPVVDTNASPGCIARQASHRAGDRRRRFRASLRARPWPTKRHSSPAQFSVTHTTARSGPRWTERYICSWWGPSLGGRPPALPWNRWTPSQPQRRARFRTGRATGSSGPSSFPAPAIRLRLRCPRPSVVVACGERGAARARRRRRRRLATRQSVSPRRRRRRRWRSKARRRRRPRQSASRPAGSAAWRTRSSRASTCAPTSSAGGQASSSSWMRRMLSTGSGDTFATSSSTENADVVYVFGSFNSHDDLYSVRLSVQ